MMTMLAEGPFGHVVQHPVLTLNPEAGPLGLTLFSNHIFMQIVAAALLILVIPRAIAARAGTDAVGRLVPTGLGNALEALCFGLRDQIFKPNLGKYADVFTPYLWSLFFFIFVSNALGLIPLIDWFKWVPGGFVGGTSTGNIFVTGTLSIATLGLVVYNGLRYHGMAYVQHFFMGPPGINIFIAILEVAGLAFKTMALCLRLFANMLAGHIILAVLIGFIPAAIKALPLYGSAGVTIGVILGSVAFNFLEILVAFLHAFIFTTLTAVFIGQAVNIHHDDHDEHHAAHGAEGAHGHKQVHAAH